MREDGGKKREGVHWVGGKGSKEEGGIGKNKGVRQKDEGGGGKENEGGGRGIGRRKERGMNEREEEELKKERGMERRRPLRLPKNIRTSSQPVRLLDQQDSPAIPHSSLARHCIIHLIQLGQNALLVKQLQVSFDENQLFEVVRVELLGLRMSDPTLKSLSTAAEEGRGVSYLTNKSTQAFLCGVVLKGHHCTN